VSVGTETIVARQFMLEPMQQRFRPVGTVGLCPEGTIGLSPGLQPREHVHTMSRPEGGGRYLSSAVHLVNPYHPTRRFYRPFGAGRFINRYLGLKPQAESYSPYGTKADRPYGMVFDVRTSVRIANSSSLPILCGR